MILDSIHYLTESYTRWKIITSVFASLFWVASSAIIYLHFKKAIPMAALVSMDNVWAPLFVFVVTVFCNKYREAIIKRVRVWTIVYMVALTLTDMFLFYVNEYTLFNYVLQIVTEVSILQLYCYGMDGFDGKVFFKADSQQKFSQWTRPIHLVAVLCGGILGMMFAQFSLRTLVTIQIVYDLVWCFLQLKVISAGQDKIDNGELL